MQDFNEESRLLRRSARASADISAASDLSAGGDFKAVQRLCKLAMLSAAEPRPEPSWLAPSSLADAKAALAEVRGTHLDLRAAHTAAADLFTEAVLDQEDLASLAGRITDPPRALFLSRSYREDRRALAALTVSGSWHKVLPERVGQAVAWQAAQHAFAEAISRHDMALGGRLCGAETDFTELAEALKRAARIIELGTDVDPVPLVAQCGSPAAHAFAQTAKETAKALKAWRSRLVPAPLPGEPPALSLLSLEDATAWYEAWTGPLTVLADACASVEVAAGSDVDYARASPSSSRRSSTAPFGHHSSAMGRQTARF